MEAFLSATCRCGADGYLQSISNSGESSSALGWGFEVAIDAYPVVPPERSLRIALHEASHAVVGFAVGIPVNSITIDGQPHVSYSPAVETDCLKRTAVSLSGPHGENLLFRRYEYRPLDREVLALFEVVRDLRFGGCDACAAAVALYGACGSETSDTERLALYRRVEDCTISILREPRIGAAARRLAARLMEFGTVPGTEAHEIIEAIGVEFGARQIG